MDALFGCPIERFQPPVVEGDTIVAPCEGIGEMTVPVKGAA
jgi:hypothetical protein